MKTEINHILILQRFLNISSKIITINDTFIARKYISHYDNTPMQYIEDIQMFLLNMAFISSSEVKNIYIS